MQPECAHGLGPSPLSAAVVRILEHGGLIPCLAVNGGFR